jgi:hypothetical protein
MRRPGLESVAKFRHIENCRASLAPRGVVYPKDTKDMTEAQVMAAGLSTEIVSEERQAR